MSHIQRTAAGYDVGASKKRVNVTLNEDLVRVAQAYTDNLSGTIETLLATWAQTERRKREDDQEHRRKVAAEWNRDFMPDDESR